MVRTIKISECHVNAGNQEYQSLNVIENFDNFDNFDNFENDP